MLLTNYLVRYQRQSQFKVILFIWELRRLNL